MRGVTCGLLTGQPLCRSGLLRWLAWTCGSILLLAVVSRNRLHQVVQMSTAHTISLFPLPLETRNDPASPGKQLYGSPNSPSGAHNPLMVNTLSGADWLTSAVRDPIRVKMYINPNAVALIDLQYSGNIREECRLEVDCIFEPYKRRGRLINERPFREYDAIVAMSDHKQLRADYNQSRDARQIWVFADVEAAPMSYVYSNLNPIKHLFNWTYHMSPASDIYRPHMYSVPLGQTPPRGSNPEESHFGDASWTPDQWTQVLKKKELDFCWVFSNCVDDSGRVQTVVELAKHLPSPVHWFGRDLGCVPPDAPNIIRHGQFPGRYRSYYAHQDKIARCKFYLSIESYLCQHYVTEKLFNPLAVGAIPLVNNLRKAYDAVPPNSYIHIFDFESSRALAAHLAQLLANPLQMLEYHKWRESHFVYALHHQPLCQLCLKLIEQRRSIRSSRIDDVRKTLLANQPCESPNWKLLRDQNITLHDKFLHLKALSAARIKLPEAPN